MATLTKVNRNRIVCKTIFEERLFGVAIVGCGMLFLAVGLYALTLSLSRGSNLLPEGLWLIISLAITCVGMFHLGVLRIEWLVIDLRHRRYKGRRGFPFWNERLRGPLDDFDQIRMVEAPADHREGRPGWALEFVWRNDLHRPFRVCHWRRPRSFTLEHCWGELDSRSLLRLLKAMACDTGLPLGVPKTYLDGLGLLDSELDL